MKKLGPLLLLVLLSCSSKQQDNVKSNTAKFDEFVRNLPRNELPIHLSCGLPDGPDAVNLQSSEFNEYSQFIPSNQNLIFGIVRQTEESILMIFGESGDDIYPTLYSYNKSGARIDSLTLILSPCGGADESIIPHSIARIDTDLRITLTDTLKFIHYPNGNAEYILDSIKTSSVNYRLDKSGRIIKEN